MKLVFHHNAQSLPALTKEIHPVLLYDNPKESLNKYSCIGGTVIHDIRQLGIQLDNRTFDFLTISLAVTAADSVIYRNKKNKFGEYESENNWARRLEIELPLLEPKYWNKVKSDLEATLGFLTGDQWIFAFTEGGLSAPEPIDIDDGRGGNTQLMWESMHGLNAVSLFSGGLDSAIGALDFINGNTNIKPLLISHKYTKDNDKQKQLLPFLNGKYSRFGLNFYPQRLGGGIDNPNETTMRGRSFSFIAIAVIGLMALREANLNKDIKTIYIPENGYIALNPPLTRRRIGSLSTRTTHPYYLSKLQNILNEVGFNIEFNNPYEFKTKGEMLKECKDQISLKKVIPITVSCSAWHRDPKGMQCGTCVPCLIRRASIYKAGIDMDIDNYISKALKIFYDGSASDKQKDDIKSVVYACKKLKDTNTNVKEWVNMSGTLPQNNAIREELFMVFQRGLEEVAEYLESESVL